METLRESSRPRLITPAEVAQEQAQQVANAILKKLGQEERTQVVGMFLRDIHQNATEGLWGHLRLVETKVHKSLRTILWSDFVTVRESISDKKIITPETLSFGEREVSSDIDIRNLSARELELYVSSYFSDSEARKYFVNLFLREYPNFKQNVQLDIYSTWEEPIPDTPHNIHRLGEKMIPEPLSVRLWRLISGEPRRLYNYAHSNDKVRKQHNGLLSKIIPAKLARILFSRVWPYKADIIDFPDIYQAPPAPLQQSENTKSWKLSHNIPEVCEGVFVSLVMQLALLPENIDWLVWARSEIYMPWDIKAQFKRISDLSAYSKIPNYPKHIESSLLLALSYTYPELAAKHCLERAKTIHKAQLEYSCPSDATETTPEKSHAAQQVPEATKKPEWVYLELDHRVAEYYKLWERRGIRCGIEHLKQILAAPNDEPITIRLNGKPIQMPASMFRRCFHRGTPPERGVETWTVIPFPSS